MTQLAIRGHETRGKEVIELLEMLGGRCKKGYSAGGLDCYYYISDNGTIDNWYYLDEDCFITFTLEEFLERFPYKVGDKVTHSDYESPLEIVGMKWENDSIKYEVYTNDYGYWFSVDELQPYKEETMESKPNLLQQLKEYFDNTPRDVLEKEWNELSYLNEIGPTVNEYLASVKKYRQSNQYPKTYEDCIGQLPINWDGEVKGHKSDLLYNFQKLLIARDVYWKIAGKQMGLGKPWEPDYIEGVVNTYYTIHLFNNKLFLAGTSHRNAILSFPTAEMRDAFYENFKDLIIECKKLL